MYHNKKGLSTVVTTLIIILLVLVAVGIIWIVVRNVIEQGADNIDISTKCLNVDVRVTNASCSQSVGNCTADIYRKQGSEEIGGVILIYHVNKTVQTTSQIKVPGDISLLSTKKFNDAASGLGITDLDQANSVDVVPYFNNEAGVAQLCTQINSFEF